MKILSYKKLSSGKYKIIFDDQTESVFYEDVILKYQFLLKKEISKKDLCQAQDYNQQYDAYYVALKSIQSRFKSIFEVRQFLLKKGYTDQEIDFAISLLVKQGYLNDQVFARSYIHQQLITSFKGPKKIIHELSDLGVCMDIILEEISCYTLDLQKQKIHQLIEKYIKRNHKLAGTVFQKKISQDLSLLGYDRFVFTPIFSEFDFSSSSDLYEQEYRKLYRKFSKKYKGLELERKIKIQMYQKGFVCDESQTIYEET